MGNVFSVPDLQQQIKDRQRQLFKSIIFMQRDDVRLTEEEKQLKQKLRQQAHGNVEPDHEIVRSLVLEVVRVQKRRRELTRTIHQFQCAQSSLASALSIGMVAETMKTVGGTLERMNRTVGLGHLNSITTNFAKQSSYLNEKQELLDETLHEAQDSDDNDRTEEMVAKIYDEVGLRMQTGLVDVPTQKTNERVRPAPNEVEDSLLQQIKQLPHAANDDAASSKATDRKEEKKR